MGSYQRKKKNGRFLVKNNEMVLKKTEKPKFSQINGKRCYFSDGIVSLPLSHPVLTNINKFKIKKQQKIESFLLVEKHRLIQREKYAEVHSFGKKRGIDLRNCFHLKIKELKDKKKYSQKSIDSYLLPKVESCLLHHPRGQLKKKLVTDEDHETRKKLKMNKNKKRWKKKNKKEKNEEARLRQKLRS